MRSLATPMLRVWLCLLLLLGATGCSAGRSRLVKVLVPQDFVYAPPPDASPAAVTFKSGFRGEIPVSYRLEPGAAQPTLSPPTITRDGWIEVTPLGPPVQVRTYVRNVGVDESEFFEVKSFTGEVPYRLPSEVRFSEGTTPTTAPSRLILRNLKNPYNGYTLRDGALVLVEITDPAKLKTWRDLFLYKDFGSRQKISFNVVFNVPSSVLKNLGLPVTDGGVGNAAFTMSYSYGYRFRTQNDALRWVGDKCAVVILLGTSATPVFTDAWLNQISLGTGLEFYDFLSLNLLMDANSLGNFSSGRWGVVVGFDAVRAADFTRKITQKLFYSNQLK